MFKLHLDWWLTLPAILLCLLGITILRSVAPQLVGDQLIFMVVAALAFLALSFLDYDIIFSLRFPVYFLSLLLLALPFVFGVHSRGAQRWLQFGSFNLQPSEIIKPAMLIVFAAVATSKLSHRTILLLGSAILPLLLIFKQPDLGTTLVLLCGWLVIFFSQVRLKYFFPLLAVVLISLFPVYRFVLHDYQRQRLQTFINPYADPLGRGYHVIQSMIAVGSGKLSGRGLGQGTQSQLRFLPEHHTDFIFASLSEELGFAGSLLVLVLFLVLLWRIYRISQTVRSPAASMFCLAAAVMLAFQAFVNIGMNMGIAPITGITLPFLSYGGSSLLSLGITLGIVNSISRSASTQDTFIIS
jgi:rod shape determining protein RodA